MQGAAADAFHVFHIALRAAVVSPAAAVFTVSVKGCVKYFAVFRQRFADLAVDLFIKIADLLGALGGGEDLHFVDHAVQQGVAQIAVSADDQRTDIDALACEGGDFRCGN